MEVFLLLGTFLSINVTFQCEQNSLKVTYFDFDGNWTVKVKYFNNVFI